jgi:putative tryptophan/tyrosine transport system substrate-binding protein
MGTIGILHSGPPEIAQNDVDDVTNRLNKKCKKRPNIEVPDWKDNLLARAKSLIHKKVPVLLARGGSRSAHAAINARGSAKSPIIVFTSVAPYILDEIDPTVTTGVCAHTSDHDDDRLDWLLKMLQYIYPTIGVLRNSNRGDTTDQWQSIVDQAEGRCDLVSADLNGPLTIRKAFELFQKKGVDALLVAADPFFYGHRQEVVDRANNANYPAIYQWSEFVEAGGLMSFGAKRKDCYDRAIQMAADIDNGSKVPPVYEVSDANFELVVSEDKAKKFGRWPLPPVIDGDPRLKVI